MELSKKSVITFTTSVFLLSLPLYIILIKTGISSLSILLLMWVPTLASVITLTAHQVNWRTLGLFSISIPYILLAGLIPIIACLIVYGSVWLLGLADVDITRFTRGENLNTSLFNLFTIYLLHSIKSALGEEIGWRGLLTPLCLQWVNNHLVKTIALVGIIWFVWHLPLILSGDYTNGNSAYITIPAFFLNILSATAIFTILRMITGSFWSAAMFHGMHNLMVQMVFDTITIDTSGYATYITSEFGFGLSIVYFFIAWILYRTHSFQKTAPIKKS